MSCVSRLDDAENSMLGAKWLPESSEDAGEEDTKGACMNADLVLALLDSCMTGGVPNLSLLRSAMLL